jgi:hypothetical protein
MAKTKKVVKEYEYKYPKTPAIDEWMHLANKEMIELLEELAATTLGQYRQWVVGRRGISATLAGRLEAGTLFIKEKFGKPAPPPVLRGDLCDACRLCPHFHKSIGLEVPKIDENI